MKAVSLFAGVGGFDLALTRAGVDVVAAVEIDKAARGVLAYRFPETQLFDDVRNVTAYDITTAGFNLDTGILVGGFPCQDLSVAGKRAGLAGTRSGLFWEIIRLAEQTQPKWLILENVPGLLTSNHGRDMATVIGALVDLGYSVAWRVLDAQHFGVPQRRRRVFIVAGRTSTQRVGKVLFESQSGPGDSAPGGKAMQATTRSVASSTVPNRGVLGSDHVGTLAARDYKGVGNQYVNENKLVVQHFPIQGSMIGRSDMAGPAGPGYGQPNDPMFTLTSTDRHGVAHVSNVSSVVRRLTPIECERLQGFPDDWTQQRWDEAKGKVVDQADAPRYKQMGNAVAVPVVQWAVNRLIAVECEA